MPVFPPTRYCMMNEQLCHIEIDYLGWYDWRVSHYADLYNAWNIRISRKVDNPNMT